MRILFAVPYVPNLVRTRSYNLIRQLAARGHQVVLAAIWTSDADRADLESLRSVCHEVHGIYLPAWRSLLACLRGLGSRQPLQSAYSWSPSMMATIDRLVRSADVLHVEHLRGARYALDVRCPPERRVPVVWDSVDCISYLFEQAVRGRTDWTGRLINRLELSRTRRAEGRLAARFDRVFVTSHIDRDALLALARRGGAGRGDVTEPRIEVLANGVDLDYFTPGEGPRDAETLVFSGKMSYHANESAVAHLVREIMPAIWNARPMARLVVVGKDPSPRLRALAEAAHGEVTVTGTVDDIRPYLRRAAVAVVPLVYGAGSQFKVLEAMACGTPVVATSKAVSALATRPGLDVVVADSPAAFAGDVLALMADGDRQRALGHAGRQYVEREHHWGQIAARLESVYREVIPAAHMSRVVPSTLEPSTRRTQPAGALSATVNTRR